jgi:hypothetical protein
MSRIPENERSVCLAWYYANREKVCAKKRASYKPKPRKKSKYGTFANTKEYYRAYRAANRERYNAARRKHYWENIEASRAYSRKMAKNWREKFPEEAKKRNYEERSKLSDSYVARCIMGIPTRQCPRDVIELVREHVKLRRELRKKPNDKANQHKRTASRPMRNHSSGAGKDHHAGCGGSDKQRQRKDRCVTARGTGISPDARRGAKAAIHGGL